MSYEHHKPGMCDKCEKQEAKHEVPFLYKDMNDVAHPDLGDGYRQYYVCTECYEKEIRLINKQRRENNDRSTQNNTMQ